MKQYLVQAMRNEGEAYVTVAAFTTKTEAIEDAKKKSRRDRNVYLVVFQEVLEEFDGR